MNLYPVPHFSTPVAPINPNPSSWVKMDLQGQALVMTAFMEDKEIMLIIHTPEMFAYLASEGMRHAMDLYNEHLWLSTVFQSPLTMTVPALPFFHIPTWETPTVPMHQQQQSVMNQASPPSFPTYQNFMDIDPLYHH